MDDSLSEAVIPPPLNVRRGQPVDLGIREQRVPSRRGTTSDYALFYGGGGGGVGRNRNANTLAHRPSRRVGVDATDQASKRSTENFLKRHDSERVLYCCVPVHQSLSNGSSRS